MNRKFNKGIWRMRFVSEFKDAYHNCSFVYVQPVHASVGCLWQYIHQKSYEWFWCFVLFFCFCFCFCFCFFVIYLRSEWYEVYVYISEIKITFLPTKKIMTRQEFELLHSQVLSNNHRETSFVLGTLRVLPKPLKNYRFLKRQKLHLVKSTKMSNE